MFPEHIFISCRDSKRSELLRSQETDTYKQNRKSADPVLAQQFQHIYKSIEAMNIASFAAALQVTKNGTSEAIPNLMTVTKFWKSSGIETLTLN